MSFTLFSLTRRLLTPICFNQVPRSRATTNHFQCNFEFKANCQSDPIRSKQSDPGFVNGQPVFKTARSICFTFFEIHLYLQEIIIGLL